jgi:hypothetical protein
MGGGNFGTRAEVFLRRFVGYSTDPSALLAMGVAGGVFRVARLATLARLSAAPSSYFTRGIGLRAAAALGGLGAESLAFPLAARLGNAALGREQEWSLSAFGREWGAGLLTLGALRSSGAAMTFAAQRWAVQGPVSTGLLAQSSMLGAIWFAQHLEGRIGWRREQGAGASFAEALGTLLHFNVGARLSRAAFGPRFASWESGLDQRAESLIHRPPPRLDSARYEGQPLLAAAIAPGREGLGLQAVQIPTTFPPSLYRDYRYPSGRGEVQPPRIRYPGEWNDWWKQWEPQLRTADPREPTETVLANRVPLAEANRFWRFQIEDFARLVGAQFSVHSPSRLLEAMGPGYLKRDPTLLRAAESLTGEGAEVYELHFPYSAVRFGEANESGNYANLHSLMTDVANSLGNHVFLANQRQGQVQVRFPSLELWEALNTARFGENAHRMVPVKGVRPRDRVMGFRQNLLAPLGLTRQATSIQDIMGKAHSFFFTLHDAFHATIASTLPASYAQTAGRLYWLTKAGLPASPLKEELLNRFSDLDPGSEFKRSSHPHEFWDFTLNHYWYSFKADAARDDFINSRLGDYAAFLQRYQSILRNTVPNNPAEARSFRYISSLLEQDSLRLNSLLAEVLRH